jgi:hypothetical protein
MQAILTLSIITCLGIITYQDFKERKISWITLPILTFLFVSNAIMQLNSWKEYFLIVGTNLIFVFFQMVFLFVYFSIKEKKWASLINTKIGIGDVLFFLVLAFAFSSLNFILFYVGSLSVITLVFLLTKVIANNISAEIPLAGAMAIVLALWYAVAFIFPTLNPFENIFLKCAAG